MSGELDDEEVGGPSVPSARRVAFVGALVVALLIPSFLALAGSVGLRWSSLHLRVGSGTRSGYFDGTPLPVRYGQPTPADPCSLPPSGPVPEGSPVFYAYHPTCLVAYNWDHQQVGILNLARSPESPPVQSPDGEYIWIDGVVVDRNGHSLSGVPPSAIRTPVWSPDSRHLCGLREVGDPSANFKYVLWTSTPGALARDVGPVGPAAGGQVEESVLACNDTRDLAVIARMAFVSTTDVWFVRLSDGRVLGHRSYPVGALATVVADPTATYIAETVQPIGGGAPQTLLLQVDTGAVVSRLDSASVLAIIGKQLIFSDGGRLGIAELDGTDVRHLSPAWIFIGALDGGPSGLLLTLRTCSTCSDQMAVLIRDASAPIPGGVLPPQN